MNTQKVAITIPRELVAMIDNMSKKRGQSRSGLISTLLKEKLTEERNRHIKETFDRVFSDESIREEQLACAKWFESAGNEEGQEW